MKTWTTDQSVVEVDRNGYGAWSFPLCTAQQDGRRIRILPRYETRSLAPVTLEPHEWIKCRVYDAEDRLVATYVNDGTPRQTSGEAA